MRCCRNLGEPSPPPPTGSLQGLTGHPACREGGGAHPPRSSQSSRRAQLPGASCAASGKPLVLHMPQLQNKEPQQAAPMAPPGSQRERNKPLVLFPLISLTFNAASQRIGILKTKISAQPSSDSRQDSGERAKWEERKSAKKTAGFGRGLPARGPRGGRPFGDLPQSPRHSLPPLRGPGHARHQTESSFKGEGTTCTVQRSETEARGKRFPFSREGPAAPHLTANDPGELGLMRCQLGRTPTLDPKSCPKAPGNLPATSRYTASQTSTGSEAVNKEVTTAEMPGGHEHFKESLGMVQLPSHNPDTPGGSPPWSLEPHPPRTSLDSGPESRDTPAVTTMGVYAGGCPCHF